MLSLAFMIALSSTSSIDGGFCPRLAKAAGLKPYEADATTTVWRRSTMRFRDYFLSGTDVTSAEIELGDDATLSDYKNVHKACVTDSKGQTYCNIEGPLTFVLVINNAVSKVNAEPGEVAKVRLEGAFVSCEQASSAQ